MPGISGIKKQFGQLYNYARIFYNNLFNPKVEFLGRVF